jgi:hypothetical protein
MLGEERVLYFSGGWAVFRTLAATPGSQGVRSSGEASGAGFGAGRPETELHGPKHRLKANISFYFMLLFVFWKKHQSKIVARFSHTCKIVARSHHASGGAKSVLQRRLHQTSASEK